MSSLEYLERLPKKRMGSGVLLLDESSRVLIVRPTYKDHWEIPGGIVELDESPMSAALREVREETGLELKSEALQLVGIDYLHADDRRTEGLMFVFYGGILSGARIREIKLATEELSEFSFRPIDEAEALLGLTVGPRVARCYTAVLGNRFGIYHEDVRQR